jgi:hypothetical protein
MIFRRGGHVSPLWRSNEFLSGRTALPMPERQVDGQKMALSVNLQGESQAPTKIRLSASYAPLATSARQEGTRA